MSKVYLLVYNAVQLAGWGSLGLQIVATFLSTGTIAINEYGLYLLTIFQGLMALEIVHSVTNISPSPIF